MIDVPPSSAYPCLLLSPSGFTIYIQGEAVVNNIKTPKEATAFMLGCYWVFNIHFPQALKKTLFFLSWLLGQNDTLPVAVQQIVNLL